MPPPPSAPPPSAPLSHTQRWRLALQHSAPVAMGYLPAGIAFGVLASAAGLPWWLSMVLSLVLYSGAAQYASIPLMASGAGLVTLALNALVINLRHVFYALPLLEHLPRRRWARAYALFALTDESFSVLTTLPAPLRTALFTRIALLNQLYWCCATAVGVGIGGGLTQWIAHLDFALTCLFLILAYEQYQSRKTFWPCVLAALAFALARWLSPSYILLTAVALCVAAIVLHAWWRSAHPQETQP